MKTARRRFRHHHARDRCPGLQPGNPGAVPPVVAPAPAEIPPVSEIHTDVP
ncbi:hypothetical protein ACRAWD_25735 [Caulobacter segnis]